jgi:hypothetical protein
MAIQPDRLREAIGEKRLNELCEQLKNNWDIVKQEKDFQEWIRKWKSGRKKTKTKFQFVLRGCFTTALLQ